MLGSYILQMVLIASTVVCIGVMPTLSERLMAATVIGDKSASVASPF